MDDNGDDAAVRQAPAVLLAERWEEHSDSAGY